MRGLVMDAILDIQDAPGRVSVTLLVYVSVEVFDEKTSLVFVTGTSCTTETKIVGTY